jgi:deoxyadenosine/deoxycytidine kinase
MRFLDFSAEDLNRFMRVQPANLSEGEARRRPVSVHLESLIGAGKSSLLEGVRELGNISVIPEDLEEWQAVPLTPLAGRPGGHGNLLQAFYGEPKAYCAAFESLVSLTKAQRHYQTVDTYFKVMERSIHSAQFVFVEMLAESGVMDQFSHAVSLKHYEHHTSGGRCAVDLFVYLEVPPEVSYERILRRGRPEEAGLTLDYLRRLAKKHDEFLGQHNPCQILRINGNQSKEAVKREFVHKLVGVPEIGMFL